MAWLKSMMIPLGGTLLFVGMTLIAASVTRNVDPNLASVTLATTFWLEFGAGALLTLCGAAAGGYGAAIMTAAATVATTDGRTTDYVLYYRYCIGTAYAFSLLAVINLVAIAGLASAGAIDRVFPRTARPGDLGGLSPAIGIPSKETSDPGPAKKDSAPAATPAGTPTATPADTPAGTPAGATSAADQHAMCIVLFFTLSMAMLGALFFIIHSLQEKWSNAVEFDVAQYWCGLWYRLGESVLFAIICFLVFRRQTSDREGDFWLPLLALFLGMFIKTGEHLVFAMSKRALLAVKAMIPFDERDDRPELPAVENLTVQKTNDTPPKLLISWSPPRGDARVLTYAIQYADAAGSVWNQHQVVDGSAVQTTCAMPAVTGTVKIRVIASGESGPGEPSSPVIVP